VHFISLYCIIVLQCTAQKPLKTKLLFMFRENIDGFCEDYRRDMSVSTVWVKYRGFKCYQRVWHWTLSGRYCAYPCVSCVWVVLEVSKRLYVWYAVVPAREFWWILYVCVFVAAEGRSYLAEGAVLYDCREVSHFLQATKTRRESRGIVYSVFRSRH
jgi:hypothetical protein